MRRFRSELIIAVSAAIGCVVAIPATAGVVRVLSERAGREVNGWRYTLSIGRYGENFPLRAAVARYFLGANTSEEALYFTTFVDGEGRPLSGAGRYVMRFAAGELPPVSAFWSLTLVRKSDRFLVENPIHRYSIGDRTPGLVKGPDGSLELYIQRDPPAGHEANWLPAPADAFELVLRAYEPREALLAGAWRVPAVTPVTRAGAAGGGR